MGWLLTFTVFSTVSIYGASACRTSFDMSNLDLKHRFLEIHTYYAVANKNPCITKILHEIYNTFLKIQSLKLH
jgi:hypothetical protein